MRNENELLFDCKNVFLGSFAENVTDFSMISKVLNRKRGTNLIVVLLSYNYL